MDTPLALIAAGAAETAREHGRKGTVRRELQHALALVVFATQCLSAISWDLAYQSADNDTGDAVREERACIELGHCTHAGPPASALGLRHGALFNRLVRHCLLSGEGLTSLQILTLAALIAAAALSAAMIWRCLSPRAGLLSMLFFLQPAAAAARFDQLTNVALAPLPLVMYSASTIFLVESGSLIMSILGSASLALAMSANLVNGLLVPFHIALAALCSPRPRVAVPVACLAFALTFTCESYDAARDILRVIVAMHPAWGTVVVGAAVGLCSGRGRGLLRVLDRSASQLRARWSAVSLRLRWRAAMKAAFVYFSSAIWIGSALVRSAVPERHYLAPLVFPLVFLAADAGDQFSKRHAILLMLIGFAALLSFPFAAFAFLLVGMFLRLFSAWALVATIASVAQRSWSLARRALSAAVRPAFVYVILGAICAGSLPDTIIVSRERLSWPIAPAEKLAKSLYQSGLTFSQILAALQRQAPGTMHYVSMLDPNIFDAPQDVRDDGWSLLALIVEPPLVERTEGVWFSFPVHGSRSAMVVRAPSYLDRTHLRTCYLGSCDDEPTADRCTEREPDQPVSHRPPYFGINKHKPDRPGEIAANSRSGRYCTLFLVPLHTFGSGVPHMVRVIDQWPLHLRISQVSGIPFQGALPGPDVELLDTRQATGTLEVQVSSDGFGPASEWLEDPPLVEVTAANQHLLKALAHASML